MIYSALKNIKSLKDLVVKKYYPVYIFYKMWKTTGKTENKKSIF